MYSDSISPFDEALSRPFLDEPVKKKWRLTKPSTWFGRTTYCSSTTTTHRMNHPLALNHDGDCERISFQSSDDHDDDHEDAPLLANDDNDRINRPSTSCFDVATDELILQLSSQVQGASCRTSFSSNSSSSSSSSSSTCSESFPFLQNLEDGITTIGSRIKKVVMRESSSSSIDLDLAILQEREVELGEIASSMRQIHDIQVDLSNIVDSQGSEVERLSFLSIESFAHANSGMEHLVRALKYQQDRKSQAYSFMASLVIVLVVCYVIGSFFSEDDPTTINEDTDQHHGSPMFLIPIITP
jgi:hypothetical protein